MANSTKWHLIHTDDFTTMVRVEVVGGVVKSVKGDAPAGLTITPSVPWLVVRANASASGFKVQPDQWTATAAGIRKEEITDPGGKLVVRVSVQAKHPIAGKLNVKAYGEDFTEAATNFWSQWKLKVADTGAHTHLHADKRYV